jgi:delta-1-pyrroline-5-carboxylate synthetase
VIVAAGGEPGVIDKIMKGDAAGTAFFTTNHDSGTHSSSVTIEKLQTDTESQVNISESAKTCRIGSRQLNELGEDTRNQILFEIARSMKSNERSIFEANEIDMQAALKEGQNPSLIQRLELSPEKLTTLIEGINSLANSPPSIGNLLGRTELSPGLILDRVSCSIGVLLVIFESRPDCLPQIAALAIKSGNGIILKGGKEAEHTNGVLHKIIVDSISRVTNERVYPAVLTLTTRAEIPGLLKLENLIDLVIPRGSKELVTYIKNHTKIPVMGHAEGVCHIYVDKDAEVWKAARVLLDSKTSYPSGTDESMNRRS